MRKKISEMILKVYCFPRISLINLEIVLLDIELQSHRGSLNKKYSFPGFI